MDDLRIIDYIKGELSDSAKVNFEQELKTNAQLAERYAHLKHIGSAAGLSGFKASIKKVENDLDGEKFFGSKPKEHLIESNTITAPKRKSRKIFALVASLLLLTLVLGLLRINRNCSDQAIAIASMEDQQIKSVTTRNSDAKKSTYQKAIQRYFGGETDKAAKQLNRISNMDPLYHEARYALALIEFERGNYKKSMQAIRAFVSTNSPIKDKAGWLYVNAKICETGFDAKLIDDYIATKPEAFYLKKALNLQKSAQHPFRAFVL